MSKKQYMFDQKTIEDAYQDYVAFMTSKKVTVSFEEAMNYGMDDPEFDLEVIFTYLDRRMLGFTKYGYPKFPEILEK